MITIHKYELPLATGPMDIEMPEGAKILTLQIQGETACMWAQVDTDNEMGTRSFTWAMTGGMVPGDGDHIGTVQHADGRLICHLYELTKGAGDDE